MNLFLDSLPVQQDANTRISVDRSPIEPNFPTIGNGTNVIYNHTYYNCTSPLDNINFRDAKIVGSLLPLGVVCLMVILGNIMVITAIRITKKLRGATNMFIGEKTMKPWIPVMRNSTIARFGKPRLKCKFIALMWVKNIIYLHSTNSHKFDTYSLKSKVLLFTDRCGWQNFWSSLLRLVDRL